MEGLEIGLPLALLVLAFLLKLLIDRASTAPIFISSLLELPVDISFLAMSFIVAFAIRAGAEAGQGLLIFIGYVVASIVLVFLWRRSNLFFEQNKFGWCATLSGINYVVSCIGVYVAIQLVKGGA